MSLWIFVTFGGTKYWIFCLCSIHISLKYSEPWIISILKTLHLSIAASTPAFYLALDYSLFVLTLGILLLKALWIIRSGPLLTSCKSAHLSSLQRVLPWQHNWLKITPPLTNTTTHFPTYHCDLFFFLVFIIAHSSTLLYISLFILHYKFMKTSLILF